jgi:signal transduction histidine kinase
MSAPQALKQIDRAGVAQRNRRFDAAARGDLRRSRCDDRPVTARLADAETEARRRLERDLHDGAQQILVLAALTLRRAQALARGTPAEGPVAEAFDQVEQALAELRDLARGIHPAPLSQGGLAGALKGLTSRSPVPVELRAPLARAAPAAEAAIYFTVAEALTNIAKHARATLVRVEVDLHNGVLTARVEDDGVGDAAATPGSGLDGLTHRLDALGGTLLVHSPPGGGTIIRAHVPSRPQAGPRSG